MYETIKGDDRSADTLIRIRVTVEPAGDGRCLIRAIREVPILAPEGDPSGRPRLAPGGGPSYAGPIAITQSVVTVDRWGPTGVMPAITFADWTKPDGEADPDFRHAPPEGYAPATIGGAAPGPSGGA